MRLGFRKLLTILGVILILLSGLLGDWAIWLGGPIAFLGVIFQYVDRGS